jgi:hypothetical protein
VKPTRRPIREHHLEPSELLLVQRLVSSIDERGAIRAIETNLEPRVLESAVNNRWLRRYESPIGVIVGIGHRGYSFVSKADWSHRPNPIARCNQAALQCALLTLNAARIVTRVDASCAFETRGGRIHLLRAFALLEDRAAPRPTRAHPLTAFVSFTATGYTLHWVTGATRRATARETPRRPAD